MYGLRKKIVLLIGDIFLIVFSICFSVSVRTGEPVIVLDQHVGIITFSLMTYLVCFYVLDLYNLGSRLGSPSCMARFIAAPAAGTAAMAMASYLFPSLSPGKGVFLVAMVFISTLTYLWRLSLSSVLHSAVRPRNLAIIGAGNSGRTIYEALTGNGKNGYRIMGFLDDDPEKINTTIGDHPVIGGSTLLVEMAERAEIDTAVIAITHRKRPELFQAMIQSKVRGVEIYDMPSLYEEYTGKVPVMHITDDRVAYTPFQGMKRTLYMRGLKGLIDKSLSLAGLTLALPVAAVTAAAIKLDSRGPVLYRQLRVGLDGRAYELLKFRSMTVDAEAQGAQWAREKDPRVTRVGRFIRKTRIDEIPQMWNVLRGEMSFIGPRPERPEFVRDLNQEIPFYSLRHSVKPGITGWAQVNYRYGASRADSLEKLQYDLFYIKNLSAVLDLHIIMRTIRVVLFGIGAR